MSAPHHKLPDAEKAIPAFLAAFGKVKEVMPIREPGGEPQPINLVKFEQELERDRLADLRRLLAELTYIEMVEFAEGIKAAPKNVHEWSIANVQPTDPTANC